MIGCKGAAMSDCPMTTERIRPAAWRSLGRKLRPGNGLRRSWLHGWLFVAGVSFVVAVGAAAEPTTATELARSGWDHRRIDLKNPVLNRAHLLRVDLRSGKVRAGAAVAPDPDADGPAEAALTSPLKLGDDPRVVAFVNANPWDAIPDADGRRNRRWHSGQAVDIQGLAAARGTIFSPPQRGYPSVWFDSEGRVRFDEAAGEKAVRDGVAGFGWLVREGKPCVEPGGPRHPRTAIGLDREGGVLLLLVVDGRQPGFSEGMTLDELAGLMAEQGSFLAINLDGGGSSVMAVRGADGALRVVNSPSDRLLGVKIVVRPVPVLLTVSTAQDD